MTVAPARLTGGNNLACELKISLDEIRPSIWRIVVVPQGQTTPTNIHGTDQNMNSGCPKLPPYATLDFLR
jgi:hypothetical protein